MGKELQIGFYAIIPAFIRYDKELCPNAKLLYGEITALCNEKGHCWAENEYFAELYGVSKTSISKWISSLIKKNYISSTITYKNNTKEIDRRYLTIVNGGIEEKLNTPIEQKLKENITVYNNTNEYKEKINKKENVECELLQEFGFSTKVCESINTWLSYKKEKKQSYKPVGLKTLLKSIQREVQKNGEESVVRAIDKSITNNYSGLFFATNNNDSNAKPIQSERGYKVL